MKTILFSIIITLIISGLNINALTCNEKELSNNYDYDHYYKYPIMQTFNDSRPIRDYHA